MAGYGALLGQPPAAPPPDPAGDLGPPPPGAAQGVGMGMPPKMPGMPPPPTGAGAMPTGDPSTDKKEAADNAVIALREVMGHYPSLANTINPVIDQIKTVAKAPSPGKAALGTPTPPGTAPADTSPTSLSGGLGGF